RKRDAPEEARVVDAFEIEPLRVCPARDEPSFETGFETDRVRRRVRHFRDLLRGRRRREGEERENREEGRQTKGDLLHGEPPQKRIALRYVMIGRSVASGCVHWCSWPAPWMTS